MPDRRIVTVCRAAAVYDGDEVESRTIDITEPVPDWPSRVDLDDIRAFYRDQAAAILGALSDALPGGTLDALFALMAADRASVLRIPRPKPKEPTDA